MRPTSLSPTIVPVPLSNRALSTTPRLPRRQSAAEPMMGGHHAASGAAACVAVASTGPYALGWYPLDPAGVLIGGMATAGTDLVCDWDHRSSTIAHSLPPLSEKRPAGGIQKPAQSSQRPSRGTSS